MSRHVSLKTKTLAIIASVVMLVLAVSSLVGTLRFNEQLDNHLRVRVNMLADIQANALAMPLWNYDETQAKRLLETLGEDPDFVSAMVADTEKKIIAQVSKGEADNFAFTLERQIMFTVGDEKTPVGLLSITFSKRHLWEAIKQQMIDAGISLAVLLLVVLGALYATLRMLTVPLDRMTHVMIRLAEGDRAIDVPALKRRDEIGNMARAVEVFKKTAIEAEEMAARQAAENARKEKRRALLESLSGDFDSTSRRVLSSVSQSSALMVDTAKSLNHVADELGARSGKVTDASMVATLNVQSVAAAAEELTASINEISRQIHRSNEVVSGAVSAAGSAEETVRSLTANSNRIGDVLGIISDITDQINLLALNATIEAARAGSAGKGFAVVASEVKNLANQAATATQEIAAQIKAIHEVTAQTAAVIVTITERIYDVKDITCTIASAVEEQGAATQEIARNAQLTAESNRHVSDSIGVVNEAVTDTRGSAERVLSAATDLKVKFGELQQGVETFLGGIRSGA